MPNDRFAARLNSFAGGAEAYWPDQSGKPSVRQMMARAATVPGLTALDLNYPDQAGPDVAGTAQAAADLGLGINGLAMRYYGNPAYRLGAFTNPDPAVRRAAIDLTKRGVDAARAAGSRLLTIWPGQDGFDTGFQADYAALWDWEIAAIAEVAAHDPDCDIAIEYKPNEPRGFSLLPDCATTLLALAEVGAANTGVTIDFAHALYADEQPAFAAALVARKSRLLGVHLNDGNAKRDDGLMVGSVHLTATLELLCQIARDGYAGVLYFDTFPDATGLDPVAECSLNIATVRRLAAVRDRLARDNRLADAMARQDAVAALDIVHAGLIGPAT